jgi:hypothetical protein
MAAPRLWDNRKCFYGLVNSGIRRKFNSSKCPPELKNSAIRENKTIAVSLTVAGGALSFVQVNSLQTRRVQSIKQRI